MLNPRTVFELQTKYGVASGAFKDAETTFETYMAECRAFVSRNLPETYNTSMDSKQRTSELLKLATSFVEKHRKPVSGYVDSDGNVDVALLLQDVNAALSGEAVIREAMQDEAVDEIQINDMKTIFVVKHGVMEPYVDSHGRVMQFSNNDEIMTLISKLVDDGQGTVPQFTEGVPLFNAKTAKDLYRLNAVHSSANARDLPPFNFPATSVVIRKFKKEHLVMKDLVNGGSCTEDMGELLTLLGRAELRVFCVGPTGSGKTTLLRIIASTTPMSKRIILIQNPTEITFYDRDSAGRNQRNVVHWEVVQSADPSKSSSATMENLISNALRQTPDVILVGEAREPGEFTQLLRAMRTGHKTYGTYHAGSSLDALERFADEVGGENPIRKVCKSLDVIISQYKFENGERRLMEITEVLGVDEHGEPIVNPLYRFDFSGDMEEDENGRTRVLGSFKHVNPMSYKMQQSMFKAGISRDKIKKFIEFDGMPKKFNDPTLPKDY